MEKLLQSLSPIEQKIVPHLNSKIDEIIEKSKLDKVTVLRALKFLENKKVLTLKSDRKTIVNLGVNGLHYKKTHLPERKLLLLIEENNHIQLQEAQKKSKLSENEFRVSLGVLKKKLLIDLKNGKLSISATKEEITKKFPEEQLLEVLPKPKESLAPEELFALANLQKRKEIIQIDEEKTISFTLTDLGKTIAGKKVKLDLIEEVTPEIIKQMPKGKKFRAYDIQAPVPKIYGGKKHFVSQSIEYGRKIWTDLGFEEMSGPLVQTSFWNFDALFQPQDHPTREMHDTYFIKDIVGSLPKKDLVTKVKKSHESGLDGSEGWKYSWNPEEAKKVLLRTHTTCLSAQALANLNLSELPKKFFNIGMCFRNETVDWSHGFQFNQTDCIVVDKNANFRHLLGYLQEFYKKMGFEKVRFTPAYFPYTEPSVEVAAFHPEKKVWLELGGAGMFRPEVIVPLLGEYVPVLAWGQGFDRILTDYYKIKDLRELYENDLKKLRSKKAWTK